MRTILEYVKSFDFEYLETYSFQRGSLMSEYKASIDKEIKELKVQLENPHFGHLKRLARLAELERIKNRKLLLFDENGELHPTGKRISTQRKWEVGAKKIMEIMAVETALTAVTSCVPTYRDAIVFLDDRSNIKSVLNICFECQFMQTNQNEMIIAGDETYLNLKALLIELGHPILSD